jgi:hypothetical protein
MNMKANIERYLPGVPFIIFLMMTFQLLNSCFYVGWFHYDSQNRLLPKDSYRANVITAEDYAKLQDRSVDRVNLSNGSSVTDRQPCYYESTLPNYKKVGDHYLLVTTVGTAHYARLWIYEMGPLLLLAILGLFITARALRRLAAETRALDSSEQGTSSAEADEVVECDP